jgi:hypothetical protein
MLSAFGDESSDETRSRVFAVGGILGSAEDWNRFRQQWTDRLNGRVFHAADCEAGRGDFKDMERGSRQQLFNDLTEILVDSKLMGYGSSIHIAGCREVVPAVLAEFPDMPYYDCFLKTVVYLADLAAKFIPRERVEFTFDQHKVTQYNAGLLYEWITQYRHDMVEKVTFATRREPGVQAADLWVREVMKRADSHVRNEPPNPRPQLQALLDTRRFRAKLTVGWELARTFEGVNINEADLSAEEYDVWRATNKLVDNLSNRFRFAAMRKWDTGTDEAV